MICWKVGVRIRRLSTSTLDYTFGINHNAVAKNFLSIKDLAELPE
jgi:hypothetical protein